METIKVSIVITDVLHVDTKTVTVTTEWGQDVALPLSQVERYGDRVFMPLWLARRIFGDEIICEARA